MIKSDQSRRSRRSRLARLGAAVTVGVILGLWLASLGLSHLYVTAITRQDCRQWWHSPAEMGLVDYRDVSFMTTDGITLHGWFIPGSNGAVIILLEGMAARGALLPEGAMLARNGYGLLLLDWRGCGISDEALHTLGYKETLDTIAAADFLLISQPNSGRIGVLGFSVGGAAAIRAAAVHPAIDAVVAMGNYHDLQAEIYGAGDEHPLLSTIFEHQISWLFQKRTGVDFDRELEPIELVGRISPRPLLLIYGQNEETLPPASGGLLFQAAGEPKELWLLPGVGHGGYFQADPEAFEQRVVAFFDAALLH